MKQNLLFIHGFRGNNLGLQKVTEENFPSSKFNVFSLDIPPAGGKTIEKFDAHHYARFIAKFIRENEIEKPIIIGHSMGSIVAAAVAERYPELIADKIIFMSPISTKPAKPFKMLVPLSIMLPNKMISYITTTYLFIPKDKDLRKDTMKTAIECGADYTTKKDVLRSAKFSISYSIEDFEIKQKTCFICGEKDRLIPKSKTEKVAKQFNGEVHYIKNAGHLINYETPKEVAKIIKNFISEK